MLNDNAHAVESFPYIFFANPFEDAESRGIRRLDPAEDEEFKLLDRPVYNIFIHQEWVYYVKDDIRGYGLHRMKFNGSNQRKLIGNLDFYHSVGINKSSIYAIQEGLLNEYSLDGKLLMKITKCKEGYVTCSDKFVFAGNLDNGIFSYDIIQNSIQKIVDCKCHQIQIYHDRIFFTATDLRSRNVHEMRLYSARLDGSNQTRISNNEIYKFSCYDGKIYYINEEYNQYPFVMNLDGTCSQKMMSIKTLSINPIGDHVVFLDAENGEFTPMKIQENNSSVHEDPFEKAFKKNTVKAKNILEYSYIWNEERLLPLISSPIKQIIGKVISSHKFSKDFTGVLVWMMNSEFNDRPEDLNELMDVCGYNPHGGSKPIFFVDSTTLGTSRKKGFLVATDGIYKRRVRVPYDGEFSCKPDLGGIMTKYIEFPVNIRGNAREELADLINLIYVISYFRESESDRAPAVRKVKRLKRSGE